MAECGRNVVSLYASLRLKHTNMYCSITNINLLRKYCKNDYCKDGEWKDGDCRVCEMQRRGSKFLLTKVRFLTTNRIGRMNFRMLERFYNLKMRKRNFLNHYSI